MIESSAPAEKTAIVDLAIIGAGPTGLAAAIYSTREEISTLLIEKAAVGGLAAITDTIDNYPGFPKGISGLELSEQLEQQARRFGAKFDLGAEVTGISTEGKLKRIATTAGAVTARAVLIATGSTYRKLDIPGEAELTGRGVHYCATCDGPLYRDKELVVIGGGNSAIQESLFLAKFASKITMLVRGDQLKGTEILIDEIKSNDKIVIHYNTVATEIVADTGRVTSIAGTSLASGKSVQYDCDGVFVFIGLYPNTGWLKADVVLDQAGFVVTGSDFATNVAGVFAAGDVRSGATWQIASAVGEGVTAALSIRNYLREQHRD